MFYKSFFLEDAESDVTTLLRKPYPDFVTALGDFAKDKKFIEFLKSKPAKASNITEVFIPVSKLIPTQNQIDLNKSLAYPLIDTASAKQCLKGGNVSIAGKKIIVYNGKYIIDGHHRWSQLYSINKDAKIACYNFVNPAVKGPIGALKMTQLSILATGADIAPEVVNGVNLLKANKEQIEKFVISRIKNGPMIAFESFNKIPAGVEGDEAKKEIADYIWENIQEMQKTSQPIKGAPKRDYMPQADKAVGSEPGTIKQMKTGIKIPISIKENIKMDAKKELRSLIREVIKKELLSEENKLGYRMSKLINNLNTNPGNYVIEELKQIVRSTGSQVPLPKEVYEKIANVYKAIDIKVAKLIEDAVHQAKLDQLKEKHEKLETIKKKANEIQKSLKPSTKKSKVTK